MQLLEVVEVFAMDWDIIARLVVALALGGAIGAEREYRSKDAGFRTHFLVALGSALFTIVSMHGFLEGGADTSRVAAQIVSGIGFLGAGTIIFQRNIIRGLTTAAGLWVTAAVGMACGTGLYALAVITTLLVLLGLEVINKFILPIRTSHVHVAFRATNESRAKIAVEQIKAISENVYLFNFHAVRSGESIVWDVSLDIKLKRTHSCKQLLEYVGLFENIVISRIE